MLNNIGCNSGKEIPCIMDQVHRMKVLNCGIHGEASKSSKDPMARLNGVMWKGSCNHLAVSMLIGRMWIKDNLYTYSCIIISLMHMCQ